MNVCPERYESILLPINLCRPTWHGTSSVYRQIRQQKAWRRPDTAAGTHPCIRPQMTNKFRRYVNLLIITSPVEDTENENYELWVRT